MSDSSKVGSPMLVTRPIVEAGFLANNKRRSSLHTFLQERLEISPMLFELLSGSGDHFQPKGLSETSPLKSQANRMKLPKITPKRIASEERTRFKKPKNKPRHRHTSIKKKKLKISEYNSKYNSRPTSTLWPPVVSNYYVHLDKPKEVTFGYFKGVRSAAC
mmetsp:Transcript_450/g.547  ORF Transcript_450/g.547 Transcript_450/m.547 type:complete len:161 (+) Transcript_450:66-548(+)